MKRILIFSLTYKPYIGGAEVAVEEITKRIPDVHFDMITLRFSNSLPHFEKIGNVNVYRIGFVTKKKIENLNFGFLNINKFFFPFMACFHALKLQKKHSYDMTWSIMANFAGFAAMFFKYVHPKIPYLLTLQEGDPLESIKKKVLFIHPLFVRIFRKADKIQAISHHLEGFAKSMGYDGDVSVIPNGVDVSAYEKYIPMSELEHYKKILGKHLQAGVDTFNQHNIVLVTTSRLVHKNGVDTIIDAMRFLPNTISLVIIGEGPLMSEFKLKLEEIPQENIKFLGHVDYEEIPYYLRAADIFVRPSRSEGFGNSFIEAMAAGIPVIATPVGGIVDFIFDPMKGMTAKPTGLFCRVDSPESLAKMVMKYVHDEELRNTVVINAKKLVKEKYDWNNIAGQMKNIFNEMLG